MNMKHQKIISKSVFYLELSVVKTKSGFKKTPPALFTVLQLPADLNRTETSFIRAE